jgi:septal ring factor EnvC (AmiA/AmiB activator)
MNIKTFLASVLFGTIAIASCSEQSHKEDKPEMDKANLNQLEKDADEKIKALDSTLKEVEIKEAELDEALNNLDFNK